MAKHISKKIVYESPYFNIVDVEIEFTPNLTRHYEIIEKNDTSMIVPINAKDEVILIREYFYAADERQIALPKGRIEKGQNALDAANRELQEEIGYKAGKLEKLGVLTISPGYYTQKTHVFLAQELTESRLPGDEDEEIEVLPMALERVEELIESGEIAEARVIAALYLAKKFLTKSKL